MCVNRETGALRVVKAINKSDISTECVNNEISILKQLDHPNIIKIYEYFEDEEHDYLIMEICKGGELFQELKEKGHFLEVEVV